MWLKLEDIDYRSDGPIIYQPTLLASQDLCYRNEKLCLHSGYITINHDKCMFYVTEKNSLPATVGFQICIICRRHQFIEDTNL